MQRSSLKISVVFLSLLLGGAGLALAQGGSDVNQLLIKAYDFLEAGKLDEAEEVLFQVQRLDPGNPLALNNLGAILVKKQRYREAYAYLEQARPRARGYKVKVNRVCDVDGLCLAFRPTQDAYGEQDLEALIKLNIALVYSKLTASGK